LLAGLSELGLCKQAMPEGYRGKGLPQKRRRGSTRAKQTMGLGRRGRGARASMPSARKAVQGREVASSCLTTQVRNTGSVAERG